MEISLKALVLAAGKGTRLHTEGVDLPKVLRQAAGRPLLAYVLDALSFLPAQDTILVVGWMKDQVPAAFPGYTSAVQEIQKGTGHARQGSTRAPQWTHGGIVFAPKPRSYSYVLNKKVKRLAMKSALSAKAAAGEIIVIDSIKMDAIKTKDFRAFLSAVKADGKSLVVTPAKDEIVIKSARNIPGVETAMAGLINVYDILKAKYLVLDKEALAVIQEVFA